MREKHPFSVIALFLATTQLLGPVSIWAAETERGVRVEPTTQGLVTGLKGHVTATSHEAAQSSRVLRFRDPVTMGDQVATGPDANIEILWHKYALVTAQEQSDMRVTEDTSGLVIQLTKGTFRVAVAKSAMKPEEIVTLQTPTARAVTRGGLFQVTVVPMKQESARAIPVGELCELENVRTLEGQAQIGSSTRGGGLVTIDAGQGVEVCSGQVGRPFVLSAAEVTAGPDLYAVAHHASTPELGTQHLAEQQMQQAMALQQALLGASESETPETQAQRATQDAIISALNVSLGTNEAGSGSNALLFGSGNPFAASPQNPDDRSGSGYGGTNSSGFNVANSDSFKFKVNGGNSLLIFTRKDPVAAVGLDPSTISCLASSGCTRDVLLDPAKVALQPQPSVNSRFTVMKELLLIGGTPNVGHGGTAPTETLIVRGATSTNVAGTQTFPPEGLYVETDFGPNEDGIPVFPLASAIAATNSTFVVETPSARVVDMRNEPVIAGGTLGQFSNRPDGVVVDQLGFGDSHVDAAITATGPTVVVEGGVTLDRRTSVTIGKTAATDKYFTDLTNSVTPDAIAFRSNAKAAETFSGSLVSVIKSASGPVSLNLQDRAVGIFDGSTITIPCKTPPCDPNTNKALLSVLDARLIGPPSVPLIDVDAAQAVAVDGMTVTPGAPPSVTVTSAVVVRSTIPLDGALLVASAPLLALTNATMTTTSHFADLAGNKNSALTANVPGNALVGLNAATLTILQGHFLNLNAASATINGYLFSLNKDSTLAINNGLLFSLTNGSSLTLNANAFGVFGGSGTNTFTVTNGLCGGGAACGQLVNSATTPFLLPNGSAVKVAGISQNLVAPSNFNVFALQNPSVRPTINIGPTDALFRVDGTSQLTINGTAVK